MNPDPNNGKQVIVREVWASNLHTELSLIQSAMPSFKFPGTIFTPKVDDKRSYSELSPSTNYSFMKANVDALNIIQLGLALSDSNGNLPKFGTQNGHIWQFNFSDFDVDRDRHNVEFIQLLKKQGMDFLRNKKEGVRSGIFRDCVLKSGLFFNSGLTWITFHGTYDFGYLIKLLIGSELPPNVHMFSHLVAQIFEPKIYDMKHVMKFCNGLYGGLEKVAKTLNVDRVTGKSHQAGSDSLLTLQAFMKLKDVYFDGNYYSGLERFQGIIYGFEEVNTMMMMIPIIPKRPPSSLLVIPTPTYSPGLLHPVVFMSRY
ncbi:probable CCR4-associated factor 1 homolog 11 [Prosopis cineraria]|uniref:probable CCR4-associated factor 1 homolog 11 n=1 Tax=Prosopis cineraria TaxID=364024 RepID=UPI00240F4FDC|nr:probable CCR4-associated factor 1 homolog 11 [Prosopis cineraria]